MSDELPAVIVVVKGGVVAEVLGTRPPRYLSSTTTSTHTPRPLTDSLMNCDVTCAAAWESAASGNMSQS